jgi:enediyne biosynthesis protein E3
MILPPAVNRLLAIRPEAVSFGRLGFLCEAGVRAHLEGVLATFIAGYNLALAIDDGAELAATLRGRYDAQHVGFAFEGVGMYLGLRDQLAPWRHSALRTFIEGPGRDFDYITAVGAGFAVARLPWGVRSWTSYARRLDPLIAWCLPDGLGFHEGVFHLSRYQDGRREPPPSLPAYARQLFDSGLGRSLWWSQGAAPRRIAAMIARFPASRQREMWCGIGVAAAYAGGIGEDGLLDLGELAGPNRADFLSGIPFATRMRQKGGNPWSGTDLACRLLLDRSSDDASDWLMEIVDGVVHDQTLDKQARLRDSYLLVRQRLVEELRTNTAEGERQCRVPAHSRSLTTASS